MISAKIMCALILPVFFQDDLDLEDDMTLREVRNHLLLSSVFRVVHPHPGVASVRALV